MTGPRFNPEDLPDMSQSESEETQYVTKEEFLRVLMALGATAENLDRIVMGCQKINHVNQLLVKRIEASEKVHEKELELIKLKIQEFEKLITFN